jgi:hypothetical protein
MPEGQRAFVRCWHLWLLSFDFRNVSKTVRETIYYPYDHFIPFVPVVTSLIGSDLEHPRVTVQSPSNNFQVNAYLFFPSRETVLIRARVLRSPISWPTSYYIMYTRRCSLRFSAQVYPNARTDTSPDIRLWFSVIHVVTDQRMHREHDDAINNTRVQ